MEKCNICGRSATSPYRVYDERGKVLNGCVAEFHTGHLQMPSESNRFHMRSEAKKIRANLKHMQLGKGMKKNPRRARRAKPLTEMQAMRNPTARIVRAKKKRIKKGGSKIHGALGKLFCTEVLQNGKWERIECMSSRSDKIAREHAIAVAKWYKKKNPGKTYRVTVS